MIATGERDAVAGWGWDGHRIDIGAYLDRLGHVDRPQAADLATLRALHRRHVTAIPFENLSIELGDGVSLDLDDIQHKLVAQRRGGYCYEHNLLFAAVLERLGYAVTGLVARVQPDKPGPRTHMLLGVEADGRPWLADVGFGGPAQLLEPVPLDLEEPVEIDGWAYRLDPGAFDGSRVLYARQGSRWSDIYAFTLEPHHPTDYAVYNHNASTSPGSPFVGQLVVQANAGRTRHRLVRDQLHTITPDGADHTPVSIPHDRLPAVLDEVFGITLSPEQAHTLTSIDTRSSRRTR